MYHRSPQRLGSDMHYSVGDLGIKLIAIGFFITGVLSYVSYMIANQQVSKTATWIPTDATISLLGANSLPMPIVGRFLPICCPFAQYSYAVDGKTYTGQQNCGPSITWIRWITFKAPAFEEPKQFDEKESSKEIEGELAEARLDSKNDQQAYQKVFEKQLANALTLHYKPVKVRYDKEHPDQSALDPDVMQGEKSQLTTSLVLMALGGIIFALTYLHTFVTAPSPDDPTLSLDAALKYQRRGGR